MDFSAGGGEVGRKSKATALIVALALSLGANLWFGLQQFHLLPHYRDYWKLRRTVSRTILGRPLPEVDSVFTTSDYVLSPSDIRTEPVFTIKAFRATGNPEQFVKDFRSELHDAFALDRIPRGDGAFAVHDSSEGEGFRRMRISYETQKGVRVPAFFIEPTQIRPPWPAVLVVHGCGYGKAGPAGVVTDNHNNIGIKLARAGFLVLAPDRRGFGELQPNPRFFWPSCGAGMSDGRYLLQRDALGTFDTIKRAFDVYDLVVATELLRSRPEVERIGVLGFSGGGLVTLYLVGQTDNVDAVVLSNGLVYGSSERGGIGVGDSGGDSDSTFPPVPTTPREILRQWPNPPPAPSWVGELVGDVPSLRLVTLTLLPPKPLLLQFGRHDPVTYQRGGEELISLARTIYQRFRASDSLERAVHEAGHEVVPESAIAFFDRHLRSSSP